MKSIYNLKLITIAVYVCIAATQITVAKINNGAASVINSYLLLDGNSPTLPPPPPPPVQNSNASWVEGDRVNGASRDRWHPFSNLNWDNLMGDYVNAANTPQGDKPFVVATPAGQGQWLDINVTSLVNKWLDKSLENHGFSARGQWTVNETDNVNQSTYLYHMDQPGTFGEGIYTSASPVNIWDCMEVQIKMNSRHPNTVQRDGVF